MSALETGLLVGVGVLALAGLALLAGLLRTHKHYPRVLTRAVATGAGQWYARIAQPGLGLEALLSRGLAKGGVLRVGRGRMSFTVDGAATPVWDVPVAGSAISVSALGPSFRLRHPELGDVEVHVSTTPGAHGHPAGDIRNYGDMKAANEAAAVLTGWGAQRT